MVKKMIARAISAVLALGLSSAVNAHGTENKQQSHDIKIEGMEKCYGISKARHNDCGTSTQACAGSATYDNDKSAWILMPNGLCKKIAGGSVNAPEKA